MTILAIDDEPVMLAHLETELRKVFPKANRLSYKKVIALVSDLWGDED